MFKTIFGKKSTATATAVAASPGAPFGAGPSFGAPKSKQAEWVPPSSAAVEVPVPTSEALLDMWRQDIARVSIDLREEYPALESGHAERLLVKLAVDLEFTIRQPSAAAQEAFDVAGDPSCELSALIRIVERDPSLTRALLRTSSSAFFGGSAAPASIDDAVRRLGGKGVQVAVLSGMAEALLARPTAVYSNAAQLVWAHMVRTGPIARSLARAFDVPPHEAFVLGLLHDVGKLVLCDVVGALKEELRREVLLADGLAFDAMQRLHEALGGIALLRWGVEPKAARAVATHHRLESDLTGGRGSELIYVAERLDLAKARGRPIAIEEWITEGRLTVSPDRLAAAVEKALAMIEDG
jgi:HD-like signal output (HDOD) protein